MAGKYNHEAYMALLAEADEKKFYREATLQPKEVEGPPEPIVAMMQRILGAVCVDYNSASHKSWRSDDRLLDVRDDNGSVIAALSRIRSSDHIVAAIEKVSRLNAADVQRKWTAQAVRLAWMVEPNFVIGLANKAPRTLIRIMDGAPPATNMETGTTIPGFGNTWRQWIDSCLIYKFNKQEYDLEKVHKQLQERQVERAPGGKVPFVSSFDRGRPPWSAARRWP